MNNKEMIESDMTDVESPEAALERNSGPTADLQGDASVAAKLIYSLALLASISIWFLAIRAPLWLDETLSYWQVSGGFGKIWSRSAQMPSSIGYLYTLWAAKSVLGSSEIALKIPSTIALLVAVYFFFRVTSELFGPEVAFLTCIFFCLEGSVVFASTDARPYAFAMLATILAIRAYIRWISAGGIRQAVLFGTASAGILYFHYLFASILPAFGIYYLVARWRSIKGDARQLAVVLFSFTLVSLPLLYRVASLYHTRQTHVVKEMPHPGLVVLNTLVPEQTLIGFVIVSFLAALLRKIKLPGRNDFPLFLLGPLLALVPAGILVTISTATSAHLLIPRYLSVAAPGSALTWALLTSRIDSAWLRRIFCLGLVGITVVELYKSPQARLHEVNYKLADELVNSVRGKEEIPVLVCSGFIESDYEPLPVNPTAENALLSQMSYYPIHASFVMLPIDLNDRATQIASQTILVAAQRRQKFLVVAGLASYPILDWMANYSRGIFRPRLIGRFGDVLVAEFRPLGTDQSTSHLR